VLDEVPNVQYACAAHCFSHGFGRVQRTALVLVQHRDELRGVTVTRGEPRTVSLNGPQGALDAAAQADCLFEHCVEDWGEVTGEELITCNTSAVAVCCSNASRVSVNSRAFSIAITACAAKFSKSAICLSVNGRTSCR
jgi:hypothetical protein